MGTSSTRIRLLLDSNVVITVEPFAGHVEPGFSTAARLVRLANEQGHLLCVAPATRDDLLRGKDPARKKQRLAELAKFHELAEAPLQEDLIRRAGGSAEGSNDHRDLRVLAALDCGAATHLITEDAALRRRAGRSGLADAVLTLAESVDLLLAYAPAESTPPPRVGRPPTYTLNADQPIFDDLRSDYPGFDDWLARVKRESEDRTCYLICDDETYAALAILKIEVESSYNLPRPALKVSTFKVADGYGGSKFGELLLKAVLSDAHPSQFALLYVEVLPKHSHMLDFLGDFGFADSGKRSTRGEVVMVKPLQPGPEAGDLDDLTYQIRYGPPALRCRQAMYVVPIQPEWHDQLFPERATTAAASQQLALFSPQPLTRPWGNALRKAYLCNTSTSTIAPGDVLLFYRSVDHRSVTSVGIVEATLRSSVQDEVVRFVGRRTVYTPEEIGGMCRRVRGALALRFRQDRFLDPPWSLDELRGSGVLRSWPQSVTKVPEVGTQWIRNTISE
jgi:hypothetical protein